MYNFFSTVSSGSVTIVFFYSRSKRQANRGDTNENSGPSVTAVDRNAPSARLFIFQKSQTACLCDWLSSTGPTRVTDLRNAIPLSCLCLDNNEKYTTKNRFLRLRPCCLRSRFPSVLAFQSRRMGLAFYQLFRDFSAVTFVDICLLTKIKSQ